MVGCGNIVQYIELHSDNFHFLFKQCVELGNVFVVNSTSYFGFFELVPVFVVNSKIRCVFIYSFLNS